MKLTNLQIYTLAEKVNGAFTGEEKMPIKLNFLFQKNAKLLLELAKEIDAARIGIGEKYGERTEEGYTIASEHITEANQEYVDLMEIEQDVNISTILIDNLPDDLILTTSQMDALSFMIVEE